MSGGTDTADMRGKTARARCGASVREGHNQPSRPDGTRHGATAGAMRCAGAANEGVRILKRYPRMPPTWRSLTLEAIPTIPQREFERLI